MQLPVEQSAQAQVEPVEKPAADVDAEAGESRGESGHIGEVGVPLLGELSR